MIRALLLALSLALAACMPQAPVATSADPAAQPRIWYVGLAMFDESWSEGDVAAASSALAAERAQNYQFAPLVMSYGPQRRFPPPDRANVVGVMSQIAQRARFGDLVVLYVSTHGAPGLLAREADGQQLEPATPDEVREWLAPLGDRPTIVVLSACFSASFIPALQSDHRIILTAARPDRTSFGCQAGAEHTVFGEALLNALAQPATSLRTVVDHVRAEVAARERQLRVRLPSEPQVFVGPAVASLYDAAVF